MSVDRPQGRPVGSPPAVHLVGSLDTKGEEYAFVRDRLLQAGVPVAVVDTGILGEPSIAVDVSRATIAAAVGASIPDLAARADRGAAVEAMAAGAARILTDRTARGEVAGVLVLGGSNAGYVMSVIAAALPFGLPKVLVSTIVAGDTRPYVGTSDLMMIYPVVDIAGLNSISIPVLAKAADALIGIVGGAPIPRPPADGLSVGCTMFGVTTGCVSAVQAGLEARGDQVQVFHATGTGGRAFEALIDADAFDIVVDVTTTELADDLVGGVCSAGPARLEAAARRGVPQIVSVGALDMVNFGPRDAVPERFAGRLLLAHNPAVTLMRTDAAECAELGRRIAEKLNRATAFTEVHVPSQGFSQISTEGAVFHDPDADAALVDALRLHLDERIPLFIHDLAINDPEFAREILVGVDRARRHIQKGEPSHAHS